MTRLIIKGSIFKHAKTFKSCPINRDYSKQVCKYLNITGWPYLKILETKNILAQKWNTGNVVHADKTAKVRKALH